MEGLRAAGMALATVNSALLVVLLTVWLRNYRKFRSTMVLGLVGFSAVLLLENLIAVFFFFRSMSMLYSSDPLVGEIVVGMRLLELLAIAFLTYVTLQ
ncbi:hypothetical protein [Halovenus marina]|uniref:hypothetical protein n=1 Tax=Halovenus marina TaxID=3396621 RepID=UPI003F567B5A